MPKAPKQGKIKTKTSKQQNHTTFHITLKEMKAFLFHLDRNNTPLVSSTKSVPSFVECFFPHGFLTDESIAPSVLQYENTSNATIYKVFNGADITNSLNHKIIDYFINKPHQWSDYIAQCNQIITTRHIPVRDLSTYLTTKVLIHTEQYLSVAHANQIRYVLGSNLGEALAFSIMYILMKGNISFLLDLPQDTSKTYTIPSVSNAYLKRILRDAYEDDLRFERLYQNYSKLFESITDIVFPTAIPHSDTVFLDYLLEQIIQNKSQCSLKIIGPTGTEKNSITQLLFLRLFKTISKDTPFYPFYISLRKINRLLKSSRDHLDAALYPALDRFIEICQAAPEITPVVFIDDLTEYDWGTDGHSQYPHLDYEIDEYISASPIASRVKYVVSVDQGFSENTTRNKAHLPFHSEGYHCVVRTTPLPVSNRQLLRDILIRYREIYKGSSSTVDSFMKQLIALRFNTLDLSQIRVLDRLLQTKTAANSVSDLYQSECERRLHILANEFSTTAAYAYEYAYGKRILPENQHTAHVRELMYHHKSFIEYLVAVHYLNSLEDVSDIQAIHNVVLPKGITYFVVDILRNNLHKEQSVLNFSKEYYEQLEIHGKSQIAYLLGRIPHPSYTKDAADLLIGWYQKESKLLYSLDPSSLQYRQQLFLLRSISVSLIYMGKDKYASLYLESLIANDTANDINRGFHLEYYGDISYNPTLLILEYRDDKTRGNISIKQLIHYLNTSLQGSVFSPSFDLNLFSLCSLLQARCYSADPNTLDITPHLPETIRLLERRLASAQDSCQKVMHYFRFILLDFKRILSREGDRFTSIPTALYNSLSKAESILRTGWVDRNIPNPENIVEHTFSAWQIALLFLPAQYHDPTYSKQAVLDMLLIHDLGEIFVGDVTPAHDTPSHRKMEDLYMRNIFLSGTHPDAANLVNYYELWNDWTQQYTLSSKIAKDIDRIQCCYRLCRYHLQYPELLSKETTLNWISGYQFKTAIGETILSQLIRNNPEFHTIFCN